MADDLRERVRQGDFATLTDPALPLYLLADGPSAAWWVEGAWRCGALLVKTLAANIPDRRVAWELGEWAYEQEVRLQPYFWRLLHELAKGARTPTAATRHQLYMELWQSLSKNNNHHPLLFARRLRALVPSALPEVDAALAVLEMCTGLQ